MDMGKKAGEKRTLPGKKTEELLKLRNEYIPKAVFQIGPIFIKRGQGALIEDVDGNEFIDFAGGIGVLNIGQKHEEVVEAVKEQMDKHLHANHNITMYESYARLGKKLTEITPGHFKKQVLFSNSGAEGIENAIKIARRYRGRYGIIAFEGAFHGRTALTMGLTSQVRNYKYGFGPFDPGIYRFPYAYGYRAPFGVTPSEYGEYCVQRIEDSLKSYLAPEEVAAIIFEPILGEGGFIIPPPEFVKGLRRICDTYDISLIADEIQCGMGRTGKMWAVENFDVVPDILVASKSLGGGLPIAATVARKEMMDSVDVGGLGGTFNGNPLSCVAALKVLEIFKRDKILERAIELGGIAKARLEKMKTKYDIIGDVRGLGSLMGVEFVKDRETKEPAAEKVALVLKECHEHGLIIMPAGHFKNIIRFLWPLVIKTEELEKGLDILDSAIARVADG
jgi:4-aminobutyrate aminotransferase/(S)-3-amino-2-methylpropionate transaminase